MTFVATLAALALGAQVASPEVIEELTGIEQQLTDAYKSGRCDEWAAWLAAEWSVTHVTGTTLSRDQALAMCRAPLAPIERAEIEVTSVRTYGDTAIVTGLSTFATGGSAPVTARLRFTDVFVRRDGRWLAVASHATRVP